MAYKVIIEGLALSLHIGAYAEERKQIQTVLVDVEACVAGVPGETLEGVVDYGVLRRRVLEVSGVRAYHLLESLGEAILAAVLEDVRMERVRVRLLKTERYGDTRGVGVELSRQRDA